MSRSFTYNIVVSRSSEAIEKLFFDDIQQKAGRIRLRKSFISSFQKLDNKFKEDILISPFNNDEFISFETDLPGAGNAKFTTLRLVETQRILEKFVIPSDGVTLSIANKFRKKVKDLRTIDSDTLAAMRAIRPRYYISFGIGDDISTWAGPFTLDLIDANLTLRSDGIRELELGFTPTIESLKVFTNKIFLDRDLTTPFDSNAAYSEDLKIASEKTFRVEVIDRVEQLGKGVMSAEAQELLTRPPNANMSGKIANEYLNKRRRLESFVPQRLSTLNNSDDRWNYAIRSLLQKFVGDRFQSVPNGNVLVLFPQDLDRPAADSKSPININSLATIGKRNQDIISLYRSILWEYGIGISTLDPIDPEAITDPSATATWSNQTIKQNIARIFNELRPLIDKENRLGGRSKLSADEQATAKRLRQELKDARTRQARVDRANTGPAAGFVDNQTLGRQVRKAKLTNGVKLLSEDQRQQIEKVTLYILNELKTDDSDGNILEVLRPIYKFFRTLKSKTGQFIDPVVFEENDLRITKLLYEYGIIESADSSVVFVGDYNLIRSLVYSQSTELPAKAQGATFSLSEDRDVLQKKWADYKKEAGILFRDRRGRKTGLTSSFGEAIDFGPYPKYLDLVTPDTMVFMHNFKNSNVLDVSFDSSPYKAELLTIANESTYNLLDQAIDGDQVILDQTTDVEEIKQFVDDLVANSIRGDKEAILPGNVLESLRGDEVFLKVVKDSPKVSEMRLIDFLDLILFKSKLRDTTEDVYKDFVPGKGNKLRDEADIIRRVNKYVIEVNIKTLPFFNTSYYLERNCILMGAPNKIIGTNRFAGSLPPPSIFSNKYKIFGYKHVITPTEAYSQFTLFQDGYNPIANLNITVGEYFEVETEQLKPEEEKKDGVTTPRQLPPR